MRTTNIETKMNIWDSLLVTLFYGCGVWTLLSTVQYTVMTTKYSFLHFFTIISLIPSFWVNKVDDKRNYFQSIFNAVLNVIMQYVPETLKSHTIRAEDSSHPSRTLHCTKLFTCSSRSLLRKHRQLFPK